MDRQHCRMFGSVHQRFRQCLEHEVLQIALHVHVVDRLQSNLNQVSSLLHHQLCCSQRNVPLYLVLGLEQEVSQQEVGLMPR